MRPIVVAWLDARGWPAWVAPDYVIMVGLASVLLAAIALRLTRDDGGDVREAAVALALAYVGALAGGYVFEFVRALPRSIPVALADRSLAPLVSVGRAAYGGLLGGIAAPALYLRWRRAPLAPFFDRVAIGTGLTFTLVRVGCFLEGCDFGLPTGSSLGVRFPPDSAAAVDHAARGWVRPGATSLPVHPTQLYESAVGLAAALAAAWVYRRQSARDGRAFAAFLAVYAAGRFSVEGLRGDVSRGVYGALSSSQIVSIAMAVAAAVMARRALLAISPAARPSAPR
ncbi:MAG: prolipoprotein diacylglyceryl transferase [Polyangiales bacterium]